MLDSLPWVSAAGSRVDALDVESLSQLGAATLLARETLVLGRSKGGAQATWCPATTITREGRPVVV